MPSIGSGDASIGAADPSTGSGDHSNDSDRVTHARGRIDDIVRHLGIIRGRLTEDNLTDEIAAALDDADEVVEKATDLIVSDDV